MIVTALLILWCHFVGDWYLQPRPAVSAKSVSLEVLFPHVAIATACQIPTAVWVIARSEVSFVNALTLGLVGLTIIAVVHAITDWAVWQSYNRRFSRASAGSHFENPVFWRRVAVEQFSTLAVVFIVFS